MDPTDLARAWIEAWNAGAPEGIPMTDGFTHTSPFGRIEGRETYLEWMQPMTGEGAVPLRIHRVMGDGRGAVIHYEIQLPSGPVHACDWLVTDGDQIAEVHSFYDATSMR